MNNAEQQFLNDPDKRFWTTADKLHTNLNPGDYMHVVLGLFFLKDVSDAFKERREELEAAFADPASDYYTRQARRGDPPGPRSGRAALRRMVAGGLRLSRRLLDLSAIGTARASRTAIV
jgi:hypothetical protein